MGQFTDNEMKPVEYWSMIGSGFRAEKRHYRLQTLHAIDKTLTRESRV